MRQPRPVTTERPMTPDPSRRLVILVAGLAVCCTAASSDNALENAQLALLIRQLNQLERTALEAQKLSDASARRLQGERGSGAAGRGHRHASGPNSCLSATHRLTTRRVLARRTPV